MSAGVVGASAAAAAATVQAIRASGIIVKLDPDAFGEILAREPDPLVVIGTSWTLFGSRYRYLVSHKGLAFFCETPCVIRLPPNTAIIQAKTIWIPGA